MSLLPGCSWWNRNRVSIQPVEVLLFCHFLPVPGTFHLTTVLDTSKIKTSYSPESRGRPGSPSCRHATGGNWLSEESFQKKAAWGSKVTYSQDLRGPRGGHLKQGSDAGTTVRMWTPKPDLLPAILLQAGQSLWKRLLEKPEQVGKALRKQKQNFEVVSVLAGFEREPFPWIFFSVALLLVFIKKWPLLRLERSFFQIAIIFLILQKSVFSL